MLQDTEKDLGKLVKAHEKSKKQKERCEEKVEGLIRWFKEDYVKINPKGATTALMAVEHVTALQSICRQFMIYPKYKHTDGKEYHPIADLVDLIDDQNRLMQCEIDMKHQIETNDSLVQTHEEFTHRKTEFANVKPLGIQF